MITCHRVDELGRDTDLLPRTTHTPLQHIAHPQLLAYLLNLHGFPFVCKRGLASDHKEVWALGKGSNDLLRHPVAEELLVRVSAHIHEWQNGNGGLVR